MVTSQKPFLRRTLKRLSPEHREVIRRYLTNQYSHLPSIVLLCREWTRIVDTINRPQQYTKYGRTNHTWKLVEKSVPIIFGSDYWLIRILYEVKERQFYLDIRQWEHIEDLNRYDATMNGVLLPIPHWIRLFTPIYKLIQKHKGSV